MQDDYNLRKARAQRAQCALPGMVAVFVLDCA
jgi:hypothetical protein